jgi:hypothetical protein
MAHVFKILEECFETQAAAATNFHQREPVMYSRCILEGTIPSGSATTKAPSSTFGVFQTSALTASKIYAIPHGYDYPIECESGIDSASHREYTVGATVTCSSTKIDVYPTKCAVTSAESEMWAKSGYIPYAVPINNISMIYRTIMKQRIPSYCR